MKLAFGCDHGGFEAKEFVIRILKNEGFDIIDCGTDSIKSCDYPEFAFKAAELVQKGEADKGILICSSGEGVSIAANKVKGIRCGIGYNDDVAHLIVEHNHCNMIAFGAKFMTNEEIYRRIKIFVKAQPEGDRHDRRVGLIDAYEAKEAKQS